MRIVAGVWRVDASSAQEAELAMLRRVGAPEENILIVQSNLANSYEKLGRREEALRKRRDVYSGRSKLNGEEHAKTLLAANNYASSLQGLSRFEEAKTLLRRTLPAAQRVLDESHGITLRMRMNYARALYKDDGATLDDLREAVTTLEETASIARRVLGSTHPVTVSVEQCLRDSRAALRTHEEASSTVVRY